MFIKKNVTYNLIKIIKMFLYLLYFNLYHLINFLFIKNLIIKLKYYY